MAAAPFASAAADPANSTPPPVKDGSYTEATYVSDVDYSACNFDCGPFHIVQYYFCFAAGDRTLIGHKPAPWKWEYDPAEMHSLEGQKVRLRYDQKHIWVIRTDGKELKLKQEYEKKDLFPGGKCSEAGEKSAGASGEKAVRP
jgi:hypothetical protein